MDIPVLQTERLVLRGHEVADFEDFAAIWADQAVTDQIGVPVRDHAASWASFQRNAGSWALEGHGQWAVCLRETGELVGQTGFFRALRGHSVEFDRRPEAGWVLAARAQGRGIAVEAALAAHHWFDAHHGGPSVAQVGVGNAASCAVAERLGYVAYDRVEGRETGLILWRRQGV